MCKTEEPDGSMLPGKEPAEKRGLEPKRETKQFGKKVHIRNLKKQEQLRQQRHIHHQGHIRHRKNRNHHSCLFHSYDVHGIRNHLACFRRQEVRHRNLGHRCLQQEQQRHNLKKQEQL